MRNSQDLFSSRIQLCKVEKGLKTIGFITKIMHQYLVFKSSSPNTKDFVTLDWLIKNSGPSSKDKLSSRLHLLWFTSRAVNTFYNKSKLEKKQRVDTASHCLFVFLLNMSSSSELSEASEEREALWVRGSWYDGFPDLYSESHQCIASAHTLLLRKPHHKACFARSGSCNSLVLAQGKCPLPCV